MTFTYIGIFPESYFNSSNYQRYFHHQIVFRGKIVRFFEFIRVDEIRNNVSLNKQSIKKYSKYLKIMKKIEKDFNEFVLPFMDDGRWYTINMLRSRMGKYANDISLNKFISKVFRETELLKRKRSSTIHFPGYKSVIGIYAYRIKLVNINDEINKYIVKNIVIELDRQMMLDINKSTALIQDQL